VCVESDKLTHTLVFFCDKLDFLHHFLEICDNFLSNFISQMVIVKFRSRRELSIGKRDTYALNSLERTQIQKILDNINALYCLHGHLCKFKFIKQAEVVQCAIISQYISFLNIVIVDEPAALRKCMKSTAMMTFSVMEQKLLSLNIEVSERFRFQSFDHLRKLCEGFRFPKPYIITKHGYKSGTEEMLMISLTRLSFPYKWSDLYERFPGRQRWFFARSFLLLFRFHDIELGLFITQ